MRQHRANLKWSSFQSSNFKSGKLMEREQLPKGHGAVPISQTDISIKLWWYIRVHYSLSPTEGELQQPAKWLSETHQLNMLEYSEDPERKKKTSGNLCFLCSRAVIEMVTDHLPWCMSTVPSCLLMSTCLIHAAGWGLQDGSKFPLHANETESNLLA